MQIPEMQGTVVSQDFVIFAACDEDYFDQYAQTFCRSAIRTAAHTVHIHIFNPRADQLEWCRDSGIHHTWEYISRTQFGAAVSRLQNAGGEQLRRSEVAMTKGGDVALEQRVIKTYYACARFVRLAQLKRQYCTVFACDIDAVFLRSVPQLSTDHDFYIHQIFGNKARFLAGGLYLNPSSQSFVDAYADVLAQRIQQDYLYWSLDQDVLDPLVPRYNYGQLPQSLIDWNMRPDSVIWTAKCARKSNTAFVNEQQKYAA